MIIRHKHKPNKKPTKKQLKEIENAYNSPIVYDEDCPEYSLEELREMRRMAIEKRAEQKKQVVSIRLQNETVENLKSLGSGYTSIIARMVELCMHDPELLKKCL